MIRDSDPLHHEETVNYLKYHLVLMKH